MYVHVQHVFPQHKPADLWRGFSKKAVSAFTDPVQRGGRRKMNHGVHNYPFIYSVYNCQQSRNVQQRSDRTLLFYSWVLGFVWTSPFMAASLATTMQSLGPQNSRSKHSSNCYKVCNLSPGVHHYAKCHRGTNNFCNTDTFTRN